MEKMRTSVKIWKFAALAAVMALGAFATACTEENKETGEVQLIDCTFKINVSDVTGNSVKLSAIPTKMTVKYYLSAVRKDIYDLYNSDSEFAADYLTDLKMNASEEGVDFKDYVEANRISGYTPKTISGLAPETEYVAYAYGLSDDGQINTPLSTAGFKTTEGGRLVNIGFEFDLTNVTGTEATLQIKPERNDVMYYYDLLPVATKANYTEAQIVEMLDSEGTLADNCTYGSSTYTFTGLRPLTKYCIFAFVYDEDEGAGKFVYHEFTTDAPAAEIQEAYNKWIGTWTVTSTSSELLGKPVSFDITVAEKSFCESYSVKGWGISIARTYADVAMFDAETGYMYFENGNKVASYEDSSISGDICHFSRFKYAEDTYYMITSEGVVSIVARLDDENNGTAVGNTFLMESTTYQFSCLDYFLLSGSTIYNFSAASQFTYGDFPIGPYTLKKKEYIISSDMTFSISVDETSSTTAMVSVVPSKDDEEYFFDVLLASDADSYTDDQALVSLLESAYSSYGGLENSVHKGSAHQNYSGMTAGTEYVVVAFGYDTDHPTTAVKRTRFAITGSTESNAISIYVTNPTDHGMILSVSPASSETYFCNIYKQSFVDYYGSSSENLIAAIDQYLASSGGIAANLLTGSRTQEITGLEPNTKYCVVAFCHNGSTAMSSVYKKSFSTEEAGTENDAWKAWLGTWDITSKTSEKSKSSITMRVVIKAGNPGKSYYIRGWGISGPRNSIIATVKGEFQQVDSALTIMNNQIFAEDVNYGSYGTADVLFCSRVYNPATSSYVPMVGEFYAFSGLLDKTREAGEVRCAIVTSGSTNYTVSSMEVTLITSSGGVLYYSAADGYTYGDFPIGPYTVKKVSDSQEVVTSSATMPLAGYDVNPQRFWPVGIGLQKSEGTVAEGARTPVRIGSQLHKAGQRTFGNASGSRNLGRAFMAQGGKLSYRIMEDAENQGSDKQQ